MRQKSYLRTVHRVARISVQLKQYTLSWGTFFKKNTTTSTTPPPPLSALARCNMHMYFSKCASAPSQNTTSASCSG